MTIQNPLGYIKGITFAPFHKRGSLSTQTARDSFDYRNSGRKKLP